MFSHAAAIGADIGRNSLRIAVVRMKGEILATSEIRLPEKQNSEFLVSTLIEAVRGIRSEVASDLINPMCIGISAKGFIDHQSGIVLGPNQGIQGWQNVPLSKILSDETGLPAYVGNDASMMTIAEHRFGAAKGYNNVIFVALRSGIGGGIIINGKPYRGVNNAGGEFGQMIINCDDGISSLGIRGSFEHLASASAVVRRFQEETGTGRAGEEVLSCREIFELSNTGSEPAMKVVKENAEIVGIGLANLISIFAPEIIILGGGMSYARDNYISMIKKSAFENSLENCRSEVRIERAKLGTDASLLGSAYYALIRLAGKTI
jgi:glucokinase